MSTSPERPSQAPQLDVVTIVQARSGSSRLPGKVMKPLAGKPLLARLVERVRMARLAGTVVVATTILAEDDSIEALCDAEQIACFRGHPTDLLDRHYQAAQRFGTAAVVKIPSDCPLIDPRIIDRVLGVFLTQPSRWDYVSNLHPATYPDGNDVEVMSWTALETAWREATRDFEREHTTPFLWERPQRFRLANVSWETGLDYAMTHRWTVDYEEDLRFVQSVYDALYAENPAFGLADILALLRDRPELAGLNANLAGVNWYRHHLDELQTIGSRQTRSTDVL